MKSFKKHYRSLFEDLGYPLTERSGVPSQEIVDAEQRLGVKVPTALRDYYLVAGKERRLNRCHNRLLTPKQWSVNKQRLVFLDENQSTLVWGISVRSPKAVDPSISQGMPDDTIDWCPAHRKCSVFLTVMLHYHAVMGGCRFRGQADAPEETDYRFENHGWSCHGTVNSMTVYSRQDQVVCLQPPGIFENRWQILAGAKTKKRLQAIVDEIGVEYK